MKRVLLAAALLLVSGAAFAFDTKGRAGAPVLHSSTPRIGVLRVSSEYGRTESSVANMVVRSLLNELRKRGLDAYDARLTYEEIADGRGEDADYYVEIVGAGGDAGSLGGLGIGTYDVGVSVDYVVSRVAAELRVYDGRTGDVVVSETLSKRKRAVMPTSVYLGGSRLFAAIAVPFVQNAQFRSMSRAAGRDAAQLVVEAIRPQ
ncbi:MAG TPA: hypothetical protein VKB93_24135 [Thermoanaerobaculia bacterium]|nr:hypothetical protein [Thermoanaerobaculia bacterium]